jgi:hypothetical protein
MIIEENAKVLKQLYILSCYLDYDKMAELLENLSEGDKISIFSQFDVMKQAVNDSMLHKFWK